MMKQNQQSKEYKTPTFQLVRQNESNKVFFVASGPAPSPTTASGTLTNVGGWF